MPNKILIVEDEMTHQEVFKEFVMLAYLYLDKEVEIVIAGTVSEALEHTHDAFLISLDANFPNDIEGSQKKPWQEIIDSVKERSGVLIYPASGSSKDNEAIKKYSEEIKGVTIISPNGKNGGLLYNYVTSGV